MEDDGSAPTAAVEECIIISTRRVAFERGTHHSINRKPMWKQRPIYIVTQLKPISTANSPHSVTATAQFWVNRHMLQEVSFHPRINASWPHQRSCHVDQWSLCAVPSHADPSSVADLGDSCTDWHNSLKMQVSGDDTSLHAIMPKHGCTKRSTSTLLQLFGSHEPS